ncbi:RNA polymerase sigma-70 factor, Bacteroides expansion family 1 [Solitalea canadensis DSM 3403]|uniref:RNA polymerase sigma-70 factor, Bacteroides expansion family 1 n=2 Tax=Solitalea canadensis TaxID=995 RepID=H8KXC3_SOLCM|nr:RNA polymerase sigma-70 factor, Bacteroides expansion family 1 [Solitalea canadensis DSM 3403]
MAAFDELYSRYWEMLFDIACKKLHDKDDAKDIVHDLFLQLWNNRASLHVYKSFSGFLFISLKNKIIDKQRLVVSRQKKNTEIGQKQSEVYDAVNEQLNYNELNTFLNQQIDLLPEKMREIYLLSREEGLSINQIADRLLLSPQTVKNQISNALKFLRKKVVQHMMTILF